jgi:hypothetical protein
MGDHAFRVPDGGRDREGRAGPRRLHQCREPLRRDERRDERRHPPAVEGRDDGLARAADGQRLLDVAGGTGDIAFRFLKRAPGATATVLDMTESMLIEGERRSRPRSWPKSSTGSWATRWRCPSRTTASTSTRSASASGTSRASPTPCRRRSRAETRRAADGAGIQPVAQRRAAEGSTTSIPST